MVAADGFRLAFAKCALPQAVPDPVKVILPARALLELARILPGGDETVRIFASKNRVVFSAKDIEMFSGVVDGQYPDYPQLLPKSYKLRVVVPVSDLLMACKRAEIFAKTGINIVRMEIKRGDLVQADEIKVSAQSETLGSSESRIDARLDGDELLIAFNVKFLREALEALKVPAVALEASAPNAAGMLKPVGDDDTFHLIMPMHLS